MKKYKSTVLCLIVVLLFCSCSKNESEVRSDISQTLSESSTVSVTEKENMVDIVNGKYYFTGGDGYVEITEGKYFQLIDFDEDFINDLVKVYAEMGSVQSLYFNEKFVEKNNYKVDADEIRKKALESTQLKDEIVDKKAEFCINIVPDLIYYCNSDCELTYFLDEIGLWFPLIYLSNDEPKKLLNEQFGYEFVLKE